MRDADEFNNMDGMEYIASIPDGEIVVAMTVCGGNLYVASDKHLYVLADKKRLEQVGDL